MSNKSQIIPERSRDIGDFLVGRLLPFRKKRMVGPFIFIDHMGPSKLGPEKYMDIGQHPHTGLSTLTYLFEGEVHHRDTIGSNQIIKPGSVNWMTAGKGVVHTERTPEYLRNGKEFTAHGFQIWVALPKDLEGMDPQFHHVSSDDLPQWKDENSNSFKLIAGEAYGKKSPVPVHSKLYMIEVKVHKDSALHLGKELYGELGVCVVDGEVHANGEKVDKGQMLVAKHQERCELRTKAQTHLLLFGGEPYPEERFINWNFVSSRKEGIEKARKDWQEGNFPLIDGEGEPIPLP